MQSRIILEPHRLDGDTLEVAARFETGQNSHRLWWRSAQWQDSVTTAADPFVLAFLFPMMQSGGDVTVNAPVSPSLLQNLDLFMTIWHTWLPQRYRPVNLIAPHEFEPPPPPSLGQTIMPFSCGVDSSFTAFRHHQQTLGRRNKNIRAAIVMHGFDIHLDHPLSSTIYRGLLQDARFLLQSLNIQCIPLATNFHELPTTWADSHGSHLAAALHLFSRRFDTALISNSVHYTGVGKPWGTNPFTDPLFSRNHFQVLDDGGEFSRYQKTPLLSQWPQAMQKLRVCLESFETSHHNCCRCEKCIYTILSFRAAGIPQSPAFPIPLTDRQIARLHIERDLLPAGWARLNKAIRQNNLHHTSWAKAIRAANRRNHIRPYFDNLRRPFIPLRNRIRKLFRGSDLSRKQLDLAAASRISSNPP